MPAAALDSPRNHLVIGNHPTNGAKLYISYFNEFKINVSFYLSMDGPDAFYYWLRPGLVVRACLLPSY